MTILDEDRTKNISMINFIKNHKIFCVDIIGNSILVKGESDRRWVYISCKDEEELSILKRMLNNNDENFASIDDWMFPIITEGKEIVWDLFMIQYYLPDDIQLPPQEIESVSLNEKDAQIVFNNSEYKEYISPEYVKDCIRKGISAGIHENNKLVSWAITQDDGAIGFLHTLEDYRRKGYGYNITLSMIEQVRNSGGLPFANVLPTNKRSINLLLKLGFKESIKIHWFQIK
ncbi:MAG: GNAT family N-acetyltransferase [Ignavibacteriaceae bacterium]